MSKVLLGDVAVERRESIKEDADQYPSVGLEHLTSEEIELTSWDTNKTNTFTKFFRKGDVLFGRRRAYLKKAAVAPFDGVCSGDITVIAAKKERILPELLPFVIQNDNFFDYAIEKSAGSLSPRVKWEYLKDYEFELPSIEEQSKLAQVLWSIEDTKKAYKRLIKAADELVKSQFMGLIEKEKWSQMKLKDIYSLQMGKTPAREQSRYWDSPDYRWISIADLNSYRNYTGDTKEYISQAAVKESGIKRVPKNTVIMSFKLTIGKTAITSEDIYTNEAIMAFIPQNKTIDNEYLRYFLETKDWTYEGKQAVKGITLNKTSIGDTSIAVPPMDLQKQFASFVKQSDKSKFELEQSLKELTAAYKRIINENLG